MSSSTALQRVTIKTRAWCVPSVERAFDGWIEGTPSKAERRRVVDEVLKARAAWKPSQEGMQLVEELKAFVGARVGIQFWDPIMFMLDDEGPFPLEGDCKDVVLLQDGEFLQAYLVVENTRELPTSNGYSPMGYLTTRSDVAGLLAPLSDLYEIWLMPSIAKKRRSRAIAGSGQVRQAAVGGTKVLHSEEEGMQRIEVPVRAVQRAAMARDSGEDATADDISMFCWNVNNRVGRTTFRPEAANAAMETGADVLVFNEFFPGARLETFQRSLHDGGWLHQSMSEAPGVKANRVLVASRVAFSVQCLPPSTVDGHLTANALCVDVGVLRVLALRVPTYDGAARQHAWDWIAELAAELQQCGRLSVIVGDLNTSLAATGARRMEQFHRLLGNGWTRAQPEGAGSFSKGDAWLEIDHVLATASCRVSSAKYVQRTSSYALAGTAGSLSDHAALMFTAGRNDNAPTHA